MVSRPSGVSCERKDPDKDVEAELDLYMWNPTIPVEASLRCADAWFKLTGSKVQAICRYLLPSEVLEALSNSSLKLQGHSTQQSQLSLERFLKQHLQDHGILIRGPHRQPCFCWDPRLPKLRQTHEHRFPSRRLTTPK